MTDSKTQDIGAPSGGEPIEIEEQREESIPEEQLGEQFSGNELSESERGELPREQGKGEQTPANEIDEKPEDKGGESVSEEPGEVFSTIHLDELEEFDELREEKHESVQEVQPTQTHTGNRVGKRWLGLLIGLVLCLLAGTGYFLTKAGKSPTAPTQQEEEAPEPDRSTRPQDQDLLFESFVIPLKQNEKFTYISLSISFKMPNIRLKREMIKKKDQLRGLIYSILEEEINRTREIPSLEALKASIASGVNKALVHGGVQEVFVTQFLAV